MTPVKPKKKLKTAEEQQLLNEQQKAQENPWGTQWPSKIGKKDESVNGHTDGLIRDSRGVVM